MKEEGNNLERLKGKTPFLVPEGYMEGLTARIMDQLPEKELVEAKRATLSERVRPWLYLAAVFAGMGLFFKAIVGITSPEGDIAADSLLVRTEAPADPSLAIEVDEDEEYLEYIEAEYTMYLIAEEFGLSE